MRHIDADRLRRNAVVTACLNGTAALGINDVIDNEQCNQHHDDTARKRRQRFDAGSSHRS